jgi:PAS domain S-box-containing protein
MPQSESPTVLVVSPRAEEIKLITISLRGFFPGCRVEVVYSPDEAISWAPTQDWDEILIDDEWVSAGGPSSLINELKRHAPYAAILVESDHADSASALQSLQAGADFYLYRKSDGFLTELMFYTREAIHRRELRITLDQTQERRLRLLEMLTDLFYELDPDGRFLSVSPGITAILGYTAEELIGQPYTILLPLDQQALAHHRFNERRTGARATQRTELLFQPKPTQRESTVRLFADVTANGLYDARRRFLGTIGLIRDLSLAKQHDSTMQQLEQHLRQSDQLRAVAQRMTELSRSLQTPLTAVLHDSQHLLNALHDLRLDDRVKTLTGHAATAATLGQQLAQTVYESAIVSATDTVNELLDQVLSAMHLAGSPPDAIVTQFSRQLPPFQKDREKALTLFRLLLMYAQVYLVTVGRPSGLVVTTRGVGVPSSIPEAPALFPLSPPTEVEVEIRESDHSHRPSVPAAQMETVDLLTAYQLVRDLSGTLDFTAPVHGPLRIVVRLPVSPLSPRAIQEPPQPKLAISLPSGSLPIAAPGAPRGVPRVVEVGVLERRQSARISTTLAAHVTLGSTTWTGTVMNLSTGGACLTVPPDIPSIDVQVAHIALKTEIGLLELRGTAYWRSASAAPLESQGPSHHLILVFSPPRQQEAAVLASLIEAARERSLVFTLEVQLSADPQLQLSETAQPTTVWFEADQREAVRLRFTLPARLDATDQFGSLRQLSALITDMSRTGACLEVHPPPGPLSGSITLHFADPQLAARPTTDQPSAPDVVISARIIWMTGISPAERVVSTPKFEPALRVGVCFHALTSYAEREINRLLAQRLTSDEAISDALSRRSPVISISRECRSQRGQTIAIVDDHLRHPLASNLPVVIVAPGYGQTAADYAALGHFLAHHHIRVLRYDHTNHLGQSEGELQSVSLRSMQADLLKVVEWVQHTWTGAPIIVIASDMAARAALKLSGQSPPLALFVLINLVVDLQATLKTIHAHDLVTDYRFGLRRGITNLLGLNVDLDHFVGDAVAGHFTDLGSTLEDLRLAQAPLTIVTTPFDPLSPLPPSDLPHVFITALGTRNRVISVPAALTESRLTFGSQSVTAFQQILDQITSVTTLHENPVELRDQAQRSLNRQRRNEMERIRLHHHVSGVTREALWLAYHQQLPQLADLPAQWRLLDDLYRSLGPLDPATVVVEIDGSEIEFVRVMMVNQAYRARHRGWTQEPPPNLVGLGRSRESLLAARQICQRFVQELDSSFGGGLSAYPPFTTGAVQADWTAFLPLQDGTIRRIVCNLALSFVHSPLAMVKELCRVLHPQGRLVLTVFHSATDLSVLYRHNLRRVNQDEFGPQAQIVLHYLGRLREAIRHGLLHTFDRDALFHLLQQAGVAAPRVSLVFNGQAFLAVVEKGEFL